jgi:non-heme chloroperoxidase
MMTDLNEPEQNALSRRTVLSGALGTTVAMTLSSGTQKDREGDYTMSTITTNDDVQIFYKDWGRGQPIVFHHGWPLSADDWDAQMLFFVQKGYRLIGIDRRGHGRSSQVSDGHDMDHYAADSAAVVEHLDLRDAVHIGHSTGGGEVTRYVARHGKGRVAKAVLMSAVPPIMVKTPSNPGENLT